MKRQEKKRIAAVATEIFLQEHNIAHPNSTRRERREAARLLRKRVVKESPPETFTRHSAIVSAPRIIVPEIEVQVEGMKTGAQEKRSPGGLILP